MEELGLFGLVEVGMTVLCTDSGNGGMRRENNYQEKGCRMGEKPLIPLRCTKRITISRMQKSEGEKS